MKKPVNKQPRVVVRLYDWSDWCRQVLRGIQGFARAKADWRIYVAVGPGESAGIYGLDQNWDGILTHVLYDGRAIQRLMMSRSTKVVSFTAAVPRRLRNIPAVRVNEARVARAIGEHLLAGRCRHFAYMGVPSDINNFRWIALSEFAKSAGLPCDIIGHRRVGRISMRDLVRGIKRLEKPVGLVTWNMAYAREIVQACQQAKVSVPEDVAVVSWDDDALLAENMEPTITGCVLPAERLGYEAARLLDRLLRGQEPPAKAILVEPPGILHIRQSSNLTSIPDREVNLALQYMREHAAKSYRIPALLKVLRVSRSKLERDFLRVTGTTLNEAIIASHLTRAKQLLLETDWPLHLVAEYSGFGSKQHFHRTFVQIVKVTPGQYRDQFGKT